MSTINFFSKEREQFKTKYSFSQWPIQIPVNDLDEAFKRSILDAWEGFEYTFVFLLIPALRKPEDKFYTRTVFIETVWLKVTEK